MVDGVINCCIGELMILVECVECYIKENDLNIKFDYGVFFDRLYDLSGVWGDVFKINKIMKN